MAYAGALFTDSVLRGLNGVGGVVECAYVASSVVPGLPYFASKVRHYVIIVLNHVITSLRHCRAQSRHHIITSLFCPITSLRHCRAQSRY